MFNFFLVRKFFQVVELGFEMSYFSGCVVTFLKMLISLLCVCVYEHVGLYTCHRVNMEVFYRFYGIGYLLSTCGSQA